MPAVVDGVVLDEHCAAVFGFGDRDCAVVSIAVHNVVTNCEVVGAFSANGALGA